MAFVLEPASFISIRPKRKFANIDAFVTINEATTDKLTITQQPVQQGANIADHAFKEPVSFTMSILLQDNLFTTLSKIYQDIVDLQNSRIPFDVITPKRIYRNMLIQTLGQTTDKRTENCLAINLSFQEVIIVNTSTTTVPRSKQRNPGKTDATANTGKKSALLVAREGIGKLFGQ